MENCQVFISYRRNGGDILAGRISDKLKNKGYSVFYDVESMHSGKFNEQIYVAIEQCSDVLLVLPPNGLDRCWEEGDWVREEIVYALQHKKNIVPLMMNGFVYPKQLPKELEDLPMLESVSVNAEYFDAFIDRVIQLMDCPGPTAAETDVRQILTKGVRFLQYRQYEKAEVAFHEAMEMEPSDPDAYFYAAVTLLRGKRPFLVQKPVINQVLELLNVAVTMTDKAVYRCLLAYVKFDYHHMKMLRAQPDFADELAQAVSGGITEAEKQELFKLLNVEKPERF